MTSFPAWFFYQVDLPPGTVVNQHSFHANVAGVASRFPLFPTRGDPEAMAEHNDDVEGIFSDVEELEEALCALAGSDSNNCSYSQVSRGRVPID